MPETALFTTAEARAYAGSKLASETDYPTVAITAAEIEIRELFVEVTACDFFPTTHSDEYHSGDGSSILTVNWPLVTSVTAASLRSDTTWTALTAGELADLYVDPDRTRSIVWETNVWTDGTRNVKVTYVAGYTSVPKVIKDAALQVLVTSLPLSNRSRYADSYSADGVSVSFNLGDGFRDNWHAIPEVRRALRLYSERLPGLV